MKFGETENTQYSKKSIRKATISQGIAKKDKPIGVLTGRYSKKFLVKYDNLLDKHRFKENSFVIIGKY
ncbi:hypothetical protein MWH25_11220 [Natroniella acetigena]|uniref:hypothetical protein n=1 Tax=Natroniella acetigena TaxID=52004 RepID=UPI00200AA60E|nr:hypothetical protein [Natroniella acetigena]MCK8828303.1 hypothetical protein [Natroniella acetigena]